VRVIINGVRVILSTIKAPNAYYNRLLTNI